MPIFHSLVARKTGRARTIYLALNDEEKNNFKHLVDAMEKMMNPEKGRMAHKLVFVKGNEKRGKV
jgi:hypothetical protein